MVLRDDGNDEEGNGYCRLDDGLSDAQRNADKDRLAQINGPLDPQMNTEKDRLAQTRSDKRTISTNTCSSNCPEIAQVFAECLR